jgi:hypothetical protein
VKTRILVVVALVASLWLPSPALGASLDDVLGRFPDRPDWLSTDAFSSIASDAYSAQFDVPLLGRVDAFVYQLTADPIVALVLQGLPSPFDEIPKAVGITITHPALFWIKTDAAEVELDADRMPAALAALVAGDPAGLAMPKRVAVRGGMNVFGRMSLGANASVPLLSELSALRLPESLVIGFGRKGGDSLITMALPTGISWSNPFNLPNTKLDSALVRVEKITAPAPHTQVTAWATARIEGASNAFTMYATHDGTKLQSLGFDTRSASLKDVVAVLSALGNVLKLPSIPMPPDDVVTLSNRNDPIQQYGSSPPDLTRMMFQASLTGETIGELNVNARGKVFGLTVASVRLNASSSGVRFTVDPDCPLHPVGISADLTRISGSTIPVETRFEDCFSGAIVDLANAAAQVSTEAAVFTADAASKAARLGEQAGADAARFTADRFTKWEGAMATAVTGPAALKAANDTVARLERAIHDLGDTISGLEREIENLLRQAWALVTGQVAQKKEQKADTIAARDAARTQLADANHRVEEAGKALEVAAANLQSDLANVTHQLQAATLQTAAMDSVKRYAEGLTAQTILEKTGDLIRSGKVDPSIGFSPSVTDLKAAAEARSTLPQVQLTQAVTALVEAEMERQFQRQIPKLPTMSFDVPVWITTLADFLYTDQNDTLRVRSAAVRDGSEVFVFRADGKLESHKLKKCLSADRYVFVDCADSSAGRYFFDPLDGMIRFLEGNSMPACITSEAGSGRIDWRRRDDCNRSFEPFQGRLVLKRALIRAASAGALEPPSRDERGEGVTNLEPLALRPMQTER